MAAWTRAIATAQSLGSRLILGSRFTGARALHGKGPFYAAYRPDADLASAHPEFRALSELWVTGNADNAGDLPRLYSLVLNIKQVLQSGTPGDLAEPGVYRGHSAAALRKSMR